jgi:hypothetical protein
MDACKRDNDRDKLKYENLYNYLEQPNGYGDGCLCVRISRQRMRPFSYVSTHTQFYRNVCPCLFTNLYLHKHTNA